MPRLGTKNKPMSMRALLRAFQITHREGVSEDFKIDLDLLRHKDLDLSIRLGALLAFDALLINTGTNPIVASPGAPLSLDAASSPLKTMVAMIGILLVAVSAAITARAITIGEDFPTKGLRTIRKRSPGACSRRSAFRSMPRRRCSRVRRASRLPEAS